MTQHHSNHTTHISSKHRKMHKDWRFWLAMGLLLTAIVAYLFFLDDWMGPAIRA